jgi:hypothetical protein
MARQSYFVLFAAVALTTGGCASTPPISVNYYLPQGSLQIDVVRTVGCDVQDNKYILTTVTPKMVYAADYGKKKTISVRNLDGPLSNVDAAFKFTEDGRLIGLNTTQTGQGSEILKAALALANVVFPGASASGASLKAACQYARDHGKDGVLTVKFALVETFDGLPTKERISPTTEDSERFDNVGVLLDDICLTTNVVKDSGAARITYSGSSRNYVKLPLRQPAHVDIHVKPAALGECESLADDAPALWSGTAMVPQRGTEFDLLIPAAAAFGKQTFGVVLNEAGAVLELKYGKDSGAAAALGTVTEAINTAQSESSIATAAEVKAEADIIFQQERLVRCRADPPKCI